MGSNRSGLVAIVLAGLALAVAAAGTAVAVTATRVNIADPVQPAHQARVDASGRLSVGPPASTLNSAFYASAGTSALTSATNATIAVSRLAAMNPAQNSGVAHTNFYLSLVKITPNSSGSCYGSGVAVSATYSDERLPAGAQNQDTYPAPLVFRPSGTAMYCIGVQLVSENGGTPTNYYQPWVQLTGFVVSGTYGGLGSRAQRAPARPRLVSGHR